MLHIRVERFKKIIREVKKKLISLVFNSSTSKKTFYLLISFFSYSFFLILRSVVKRDGLFLRRVPIVYTVLSAPYLNFCTG